MTLQEFERRLKEVCDNVYELAAPEKERRYVVWHQYGRQHLHGDNRNVLDVPKVQLDIVTNRKSDFLVDDVCAVLWALDLPYTVISEGYAPEYNCFRTVLQTEVC